MTHDRYITTLLVQVLDAARKAGLRVLYALHHRYRPGDHDLEVHCADSGGGVGEKDLRIRHVGR